MNTRAKPRFTWRTRLAEKLFGKANGIVLGIDRDTYRIAIATVNKRGEIMAEILIPAELFDETVKGFVDTQAQRKLITG